MSVTLRSRYGVVASIDVAQSSSRWRVARPRRPGTRPSAARGVVAASEAGIAVILDRVVPTGGRQEHRRLPTAVHGEIRAGHITGKRRREVEARIAYVAGLRE